MTHYLDALNPQQREAALHTEGPLLIVAGAGAGKTKTLSFRILHLIEQGVTPEEILAITFTNKAAKEMRERVRMILQKSGQRRHSWHERPFVSTFHALGVHIIKENAAELGYTKNFSIFDRNDSLRALKDALASLGLDPKQHEPAKILSKISREKGNGISLHKYEQSAAKSYGGKVLAQIWQKYEAALKEEGALDFDDLLLKTAYLLKNNASVREKYQNTWTYIHIDEYQDTNTVQYRIVSALATKHKNLCVVGDADQTIYTWRGADINNILTFEQDYPKTKVILLEQNYRSTQTILTAANDIIKKNTLRKEKVLFTKNEEGEKITLASVYDQNAEALYIADTAATLVARGVSPREIAVLYRVNFLSRTLEEAFLNADVPYQVLGVRFFERKEIKDIISYIRAAQNPASLSDVKRIINSPPRGIGKATLLKLFTGKEQDLPMPKRIQIEKFREILVNIREKAATLKPSELIKFVMKRSGIETTFKAENSEDSERLLNIQELVSLAIKYDTLPIPQGVEKMVEDAVLASDQDTLIKDENAVKLMTVHASKGLEFDNVFICGLEEGIFPSSSGRNTKTLVEFEEERRLFYVALTRARKKVFLTCASVRTIFGQRETQVPSEFISDINDSLLEQAAEGQQMSDRRIVYID
ncbi:MAG: ATP-dependent DNA helicase PcrA [Parcubacteria group bacterium Greene1014_15]|nr:MAG: ATP-dependent DNA helicase PcrA [Parcubacteria group bacterium Greene1014_15]